MAQITYTNKSNITTSTAPIQNKVIDDDMNEIKSVVNQNTPPGVVNIYAGATAPTGWLICDGSAVSRNTYANLFLVIGTTYGDGDGSTTFNLPNLKGRIPVGYDMENVNFLTLGGSGGEETHTLTINEMPIHDHTMNPPIYKTTYNYVGGSNGDVSYADYSGLGQISIDSAGGDQPHNNLQPYLTMNYIISY